MLNTERDEQTGRADAAFDLLERSWERFVALLQRVSRLLKLKEKWEDVKAYASEHPIMTLFMLLLAAMCSVPILCFLAFVFGSLFFTFMGFLFVEGFLLTLASVLLGGVLFIVGFLSLGVSSFLAIAWYAVSTSQRLLTKVTGPGAEPGTAPSRYRLPFNLFRFENANGECVKDDGTEKM